MNNSLITAVCGIVILFSTSCKKENQNEENNFPANGTTNHSFSGSFETTYTIFGTTSEVTGYVTIDNSGNAVLDFLIGRLEGTAQKEGDKYIVSISNELGAFENITWSGTINTSTDSLYLDGVIIDGPSASLTGSLLPLFGDTEYLTKSAVVFTNLEHWDVLASVTVNGLTLSGLNEHYAINGLCDPIYATWHNIPVNREDQESHIDCHLITLVGFDGNPVTWNACYTIRFVLDENTEYDYTVTWSTGETFTDQFTTLDGGLHLPICLSISGGAAGYNCVDGECAFVSSGAAYSSLADCNTACTSVIGDCDSPAPGTVCNPATGRVWMDRNLGASQVATSPTDEAAYGDLYQWGRGTDGHQLRTSPTTSILSSSDQPGHSSFIIGAYPEYEWRSPQNSSLWQGVNGINNPCPNGFRIPTAAEWNEELNSWTSYDAAGAFDSPLKLPAGGTRDPFQEVGTGGYYWSSSPYDNFADALWYHSFAGVNGLYLTDGLSVRCIKD